MNQLSQQSIKFKALLSQIDEEVTSLKRQIKNLRKENANLVHTLEELREKQTDIFSAITESDRLAMRQEVKGLITKIDNYMSKQA
jgi:uncharacterized coiled-coil DUF342 family protein